MKQCEKCGTCQATTELMVEMRDFNPKTGTMAPQNFGAFCETCVIEKAGLIAEGFQPKVRYLYLIVLIGDEQCLPEL